MCRTLQATTLHSQNSRTVVPSHLACALPHFCSGLASSACWLHTSRHVPLTRGDLAGLGVGFSSSSKLMTSITCVQHSAAQRDGHSRFPKCHCMSTAMTTMVTTAVGGGSDCFSQKSIPALSPAATVAPPLDTLHLSLCPQHSAVALTVTLSSFFSWPSAPAPTLPLSLLPSLLCITLPTLHAFPSSFCPSPPGPLLPPCLLPCHRPSPELRPSAVLSRARPCSLQAR